MTHLYIAHPIDQARRVQLIRFKDDLRQLLEDCGQSAFWPGNAWTFGGGADRGSVQAVNEVAQDLAWGTLAYLPHDCPTLGVPVEIEKSMRSGKPTSVVAHPDVMRGSVQLADWHARGAFVTDDVQYALRHLLAAPRTTKSHTEANDVLKVVLDNPESAVPTRSYHGDAGYDLVVTQSANVPPGCFVDIQCDLRMQLPDGCWGWVVGRSSTLRSKGLLVNQGIIDAGWRGSYFVGVQNVSHVERRVVAGERLAQLILMPLIWAETEVVDERQLSTTDRGTNGFGSTGV